MIINRALQTDTGKRYGTALEFATAVGRIPVKHDWQTICHPSGEVEWRSQRSGSPDLVVRKRLRGSKWIVTIHNERPGKIRKTKRILWNEGMTARQCFIHRPPQLVKEFTQCRRLATRSRPLVWYEFCAIETPKK